MSEGNTVMFELSKADIDRANTVLAMSLIRKLFDQGKISDQVFKNIKKDYESKK